ncbi:MAG: hypothetical protein L0Y35_06660 [Flammeovirgaceae bacterium]|nr:hypothetical protein [Flammeovirgaceae bacterium]
MIRKLLFLLCFTSVNGVFAQRANNDFIDGTIGFAEKQFSLAAHYHHLWKFGKKEKLSLGLGVRATSYIASDQYYITAPAQLTSGSTSPLIFFTGIKEENIDTFLIESPQVNSLNLSIDIQYKIAPKLTAGFSIDALGFSFGGEKQGTYIRGSYQQPEKAKPSSFNILLISDNDRGSLNSEIFAKYSIKENIALKLGAQFLFTEYTTSSKVQQLPSENDRFRRKSLLLGVGVVYQLK